MIYSLFRSFYLIRLRIIFDRYMAFLDSTRLFIQKCQLKGLMVDGPGYKVDTWVSQDPLATEIDRTM